VLVDARLVGGNLGKMAALAREREASGYDGIVIPEGGYDVFLPALVALEHTESLEVGTAVAIAFARTPMTVAMSANDLQQFSMGRFVLGLGSQVKPHIERRFSMPWSRPAARMREFVLAMRAIWDCWNHGVELDFRGEFYTHTLMTPFFSALPNEYGPPKVFLAGVGQQMTAVAGEVGDGLILHSLTSERYVREVTLPSLERGFAAAGRSRAGFELSGQIFVVTGGNEADARRADVATRRQIAFYGSTPGYRSVLELHGWGATGQQLTEMSKRGEWAAMGELITDEMLQELAIVGEPDDVASGLVRRFGGLIDRVSLYAAYKMDRHVASTIVAGLHAARS
jgi:probable F420-dependent oxidoreductase